ncbi:MAG TPA: hypothetical protein VJ696_01310 [Rhodanobacteraceae bacterium]|nr:hypothetical protein [Rhodanobacteraceae bacterium]
MTIATGLLLGALALRGTADPIFANDFEIESCPAGRIETSDVEYSNGVVEDVDVRFFDGIWGRSGADDEPFPFPGLTIRATIADFERDGYLAAKFTVPAEFPDYYSGVFEHSAASAADDAPIDFSLSTACGYFPATRGPCTAHGVAPDGSGMIYWVSNPQATGYCTVAPGQTYFVNVRLTNPAASENCAGNVCRVSIYYGVALP